MLAQLALWITTAISAGGYAGVAALMAAESACTPVPSELIMPFAGYLAFTGRFSLWAAALAGAIGCNIGSAVAYQVGAWGGTRFVPRYGRYVLLDMEHLRWAERFFARYGAVAVFVARLLPLVRTFIALPAGVGRMRLLPFHVYTFVGSYIWCYALAYVGEQLGRRWDSDPRLRAVLHRFDAVIVILVVLAAGLFIWRRVRGERERTASGPF